MASPPPPGTPTIALPKKRSSIAGSSTSNNKRRKPSSVGPSHLRQASFPPESLPSGARSPSVESASVVNGPTPSVVSGVSGAGRKKKGKKGDRDGRSVSGSAVNGTTGGKGGDQVDAEDDEDDDDDLDDDEEEWEDDPAEKVVREHERMLIEAFNPDQADRYDIFRRIRLRKETVRKITNQTLSQSVPASVVTTVNAYTKVFIGELIDRAREVQLEWQVAATMNPDAEKRHPNVPDPATVISHRLIPAPHSKLDPIPADAGLKERTEEKDRGPIMPDHLREALRRYKKDKDGIVGFGGISLEGRERTAARTGGRRIFR